MEIKIIDIRETSRISPKGELVTTKMVDFMVGEYGPFTLSFSEGEFTQEKVREEVQKQKVKIEGIAGIK